MIGPSNAKGAFFDGWAARKETLRAISAVRPAFGPLILTLTILMVLGQAAWASAASQQAQPSGASQSATQAEESATQFGAINPYLGLTIDEIDLPGIPAEDANALIAMTPLKV